MTAIRVFCGRRAVIIPLSLWDALAAGRVALPSSDVPCELSRRAAQGLVPHVLAPVSAIERMPTKASERRRVRQLTQLAALLLRGASGSERVQVQRIARVGVPE